MDFKPHRLLYLKVIIAVFFVLVIFNLVILDIWLLRTKDSVIGGKNLKIFDSQSVSLEQQSDVSSRATFSSSSASCPNSCLLQINQATASMKLNQLTYNADNKSVMPTNQPAPTLTQSALSVKEFFVPFGSGSSSADDWADVYGLQAYIDGSQYGQIKKATFEASVHIPTGNETAYVRLFNVTDKHPVWFSEVSIEGGTPKLLVSKSITLDSGNKLYQIQMKTSLKYPAILDQARVHITTY